MKYIWIILFLSFPSINLAQEKAAIGMTIKEFKKTYPLAKSDSNENGITFSRLDTLYSLSEEWGYRFKEGKLNWIFFMKYIDEIKEANFKRCLYATRQLINDYTHHIGKPDTTAIGDTNFIDPYKKRHWGYEVMEARWKNYNGMKVKIEFTFLGGKGEYSFLVKVNYFDKAYPDYD
jgi:hypothetical protein